MHHESVREPSKKKFPLRVHGPPSGWHGSLPHVLLVSVLETHLPQAVFLDYVSLVFILLNSLSMETS